MTVKFTVDLWDIISFRFTNISTYEFELSDAYFRIGLNTSDDVTWQWTDQTKFDWWHWSPERHGSRFRQVKYRLRLLRFVLLQLNQLHSLYPHQVHATRMFIFNYLASQNHTSSLMLWGRNLSIVAFPNDGFNFNSKGDFGQINGKASLLVAMDFQWLAVNGTTSDILSGLNYVETELGWRNAASDASISRTVLIIANSVQGVANAVGKANSMKSAGVTIVTLAMISRESFTLSALATNSEYSLSMNYYSSPDYEYTISRELDGLIAQLASPCK
ncbi:hypothetical protein WR25_08422 [Diploscapter pachys]|uniref:VWFA domain-containing protein n=1 Tax=Diploscapter pachys TaxID=2018661 RepID=A0A2A2KTS3_9BILA|nr:hypothetical protein WR25_08422 [Diploscapter pachys]